MSPCRHDKTPWGWTATHVAAFRHTLDSGKLTENDFIGLRWRQHAWRWDRRRLCKAGESGL
ncbi:hypothetical protein NC652_016733 [Populus alba x Populus x berolinensis]|nr:hypothetical protein NC652_016733 [Populus alba x Populus x berolinensis]